jgi:protein-L-isoaspartate(D-aspartate) O-methyltransferase
MRIEASKSYLSAAVLVVIFFAAICISCLLFADPIEDKNEMIYNQQREAMVRDQIESRGVKSQMVLDAVRKVKRHLFVPEPHRHLSYTDQPLPIGEGQTISQPYIVAFMTEALDPKKTDKVLEIGAGSGYQAAILAELCDVVYTVEIIEPLGKKAQAVLKSLGYANVQVKIGDGYQGWLEHAPYDAIIVTCSPSHIPQPLKDQLAEGGRMIIPVGEFPDQELILLRKKDGILTQQVVLPVLFVPMINKEGKGY